MQVVVCRTCYEVYRRLDNLREKAERTAVVGEARPPSLTLSPLPLPAPSKGQQELLASIDATAASGRRAAAAEAGAIALSAEVAEMLRDVDSRTGKLGIEAGIIWRRRLRYAYSFFPSRIPCVTAQPLARLLFPRIVECILRVLSCPAHAGVLLVDGIVGCAS